MKNFGMFSNEKKITCPHCKQQAMIYHGKFTALMCGRMQDGAVVEGCGKMVKKNDWLVKK
jgi:hypothetical protein